MRFKPRPALILGFAAMVWTSTESRAAYVVTNLVSDIAGLAANTDLNLKNPWGVATTAGGTFWVSDQANSKATLYSGSGSTIGLVVSIPTTGSGPQGPTGQVINNSTNPADFVLAGGGKASFLFANLNGQISGWNGGTAAQAVVSGTGAIYTGLAIGQVGSHAELFAADAKGNKIDVYNSTFQNVNSTLPAGAFQDPNLPTGFKVFNVQVLNGLLYVTYDSSTNAATNGGVVAVYGLDGHFISQLISNGPGGPLEDPWGLVIAPSGFGQFGGDLLVGDKESGQINAFDPNSGAFLGLVATVTNNPASTNNGLWSLEFGTGSNSNTLYGFAGINNEADGLIVQITSVPEPNSAILAAIGGLSAIVVARRRRAARRA